MRQITQIMGLSEIRRLPRMGKIRLGVQVPRQSGQIKDCTHKEGYCFRCSIPKEVHYFVLPEDARAIYGERPAEIDILFPVGEIALRHLADVTDPNLNASLEQASQADNDLVEIPCPLLGQGKCGPQGCLMAILPRVTCEGGYHQIDTGSVMSLTEINSTLGLLSILLGHITMVPLKLRRAPQEIQYVDPKIGKATKKHHYLLKLIFEGAMNAVIKLRQDRLALAKGVGVPAPVERNPRPLNLCRACPTD